MSYNANDSNGGNRLRSHLEQLGDASGCTETWIHLSRYRRERAGGDDRNHAQ